MKLINILLALFIGVFIATTITACSKGKSPVEPVIDNAPISFGTESDNRTVLAVYNAVMDPDAKTFTVEPANRSAEYHSPLTQMFPNVLQITDINWGADFWVEMQLSHPMPGSGIDGFDPRVIAILPAYAGVSMDYTIFNVHANNTIILEPDGYTKLFDSVNPSIVGNTNPFLSYFKDEPNRVWSSTGTTEETKRWYMDVTGIGGPFVFELVVDVSTNYPDAPQPIIDNALEPHVANVNIRWGMKSDGGSSPIDVTFLDWQGSSDIKCKVEAPDLFNGAVQLYYSEPGPNPDEYVFSGAITNDLLAPEGDYSVLIAAWDIPSGIHVFHEAVASVRDEIIFNPVDVTPPWLEIAPNDVVIDGNYAYIAGGLKGLFIFDVTNPHDPVFINKVSLIHGSDVIFVSEGYAYVTDSWSDFHIVDIDPPESASVVRTIEDIGESCEIYADNGYAYLTPDIWWRNELWIIDVDPPEDAYLAKIVETPDRALDVDVAGGYAYVAGYEAGLLIIDIDPVEDAYIANSVLTPNIVNAVHVENEYAYVARELSGLDVIDIDPPEDAYIVKSVEPLHRLDRPNDVYVANGYAYMLAEYSGLRVVDIDPLEDAYVFNPLDTYYEHADHIYISEGYAYFIETTDDDYGDNKQRGEFKILDVDPPENAHFIFNKNSVGKPRNVYVDDGFAYIVNFEKAFQIINIDHPEEASVVSTLNTLDNLKGLYVKDGYAYLAAWEGGLQIVDIDPPEDLHIAKTVEISGQAENVYVIEGYAYVADLDGYLHIIDIDPLDEAYLVSSVEITTCGNSVMVSGGYAYVGDFGAGLKIIDIDPPESAFILKSIDFSGGGGDVHVAGEYVYLTNSSGLQIIDINPPEDAYLFNTVHTPSNAYEVFVTGGYAYVVISGELVIMDVDPPFSAYIVDSIDSAGIYDVYVNDGYAYVANQNSGFSVIDLW